MGKRAAQWIRLLFAPNKRRPHSWSWAPVMEDNRRAQRELQLAIDAAHAKIKEIPTSNTVRHQI